jgi:hypothetical protein
MVLRMDDPFNIDETPDSPDDEANEKKLNEYLQGYEQAIREEWEMSQGNGDTEANAKLTPAEIREKTKELLTQAVPKAVASLLYLSQHADNETVKMKAATYIIDKAIGSEKGLVGDPLEALLSGLQAKGD